MTDHQDLVIFLLAVDKTIIPLVLIGYGMIMADEVCIISNPTCDRAIMLFVRIVVPYPFSAISFINRKAKWCYFVIELVE